MKHAITFTACLLASVALLGGIADDPAEIVPLETANPVPQVDVRNVDGKTIDLAQLTGQQSSILIFYRGSWCPYCNTHLASLVDIEDDLKKLGYQLLAISPDKPEGLREAAENNKLGYTLLSDSSADAAKAFGLAFKVGAATRILYKGYGIDLAEASGEDHYILPVPAVYLSDAEGVIRYTYTNPDYKVRLSAEELLEAARLHAPASSD